MNRPFEVYSPEHRLDPASDAVTEQELWEEYVGATVFAGRGGAAEDSWLVRKPLARAAGGLPHRGGDGYVDTEDPGSALLVDWGRSGGPP